MMRIRKIAFFSICLALCLLVVKGNAAFAAGLSLELPVNGFTGNYRMVERLGYKTKIPVVTPGTCEFTTNNASIAAVDQEGNVRFVGLGETFIEVSQGNKKARVEIVVGYDAMTRAKLVSLLHRLDVYYLDEQPLFIITSPLLFTQAGIRDIMRQNELFFYPRVDAGAYCGHLAGNRGLSQDEANIHRLVAAYLFNRPHDMTKREQQIYAVIKEYLSPLPLPIMTEYEKIKGAHDFIARNTVYDAHEAKQNPDKADSSTPYGVFINKRALCGGYARAGSLLFDIMGITNCQISGSLFDGQKFVPHMWNMVKVDGQWYHVDISSDAYIRDGKGNITYGAFMVSDDDMKSYRYVWDERAYPKTK